MVNRSKNTGTATESAVVNYVHQHGFPWAKRQPLHGSYDLGDVLLDPVAQDGIVEVKGGHAAETASDAQVEKWAGEAYAEAVNADATVWFLVRKRKGHGLANPGAWPATFRLSVLAYMRGYDFRAPDGLVTMSLDSALAQVRAYGLGDSSVSPTPGVDRLS